MLEVIEKRPSRESDKTPVLFVHGAWHGAWCWDEHFLDFFAAKGYRSVAVSLRGHGKSPAPKPMQFCSMADLVDDVDSVAKSLPRPPVAASRTPAVRSARARWRGRRIRSGRRAPDEATA